MANFYVGSHQITNMWVGSTSNPPSYIGDFQFFPDKIITYAITNVAISYSSSSGIFPSRSNYATITGTVITYEDGREARRETGVVLIPSSTDPNSIYITFENDKIYWNKAEYGKTAVTARDIAIKGTLHGITTNAVNLRLYANTKTDKQQPFIWEPTWSDKVSCRGQENLKIPGHVRYYIWSEYTSGYHTTTGTTDNYAYATSYDTQGANWLEYRYGNDYLTVFANTTTSNDRSATIIAKLHDNIGGTDLQGQVTITQWAKSVSESEYEITNLFASASEIGASTYGPSSPISIYLEGRYRIIRYEDGQTIVGSWNTYTGGTSPMESILLVYEGTSNFAVEDLSYQTATTVPFNWSTPGRGQAYVYAKTANTSTSARTCTLRAVLNGEIQDIVITQKGAVPAITISPTTIDNVPSSGQTGTVTVTSNVTGWTAESSVSWMTISISGTQITYTIEASDIPSPRYATIIVKFGGEAYAYCQITQARTPDEAEIWVSNSPDISTFTPMTNATWTMPGVTTPVYILIKNNSGTPSLTNRTGWALNMTSGAQYTCVLLCTSSTATPTKLYPYQSQKYCEFKL